MHAEKESLSSSLSWLCFIGVECLYFSAFVLLLGSIGEGLLSVGGCRSRDVGVSFNADVYDCAVVIGPFSIVSVFDCIICCVVLLSVVLLNPSWRVKNEMTMMQKATAFMLVAVIITVVVRFLRGGDEWDNDGRFRWVDSLVDRKNIVWILVWREV